MTSSDPNNFIGTLIGSGILGLIATIAALVLWFIISAFFMALWIRLILMFMRGTLDREYSRMRGASGSDLSRF